jgi:hypothetical protein
LASLSTINITHHPLKKIPNNFFNGKKKHAHNNNNNNNNNSDEICVANEEKWVNEKGKMLCVQASRTTRRQKLKSPIDQSSSSSSSSSPGEGSKRDRTSFEKMFEAHNKSNLDKGGKKTIRNK